MNNALAVYWDGLPDSSHSIRDVSPEGACIETTVSWAKGTLIRLNLMVLADSEEPILPEPVSNLWSRVVRETPDGFCVEFVFESRTERIELQQFLKALYGRQKRERQDEDVKET